MNCGCCSDGVCRCHGVKKLVLGVLVLVWALWQPALDWRPSSRRSISRRRSPEACQASVQPLLYAGEKKK